MVLFGQKIRSVASVLFLNTEMLLGVHIHSRPAVPWKNPARATKLIPTFQHLPYTDRLVSLKLPSLQYRKCRGGKILMCKIIHGFLELTDLYSLLEIHFPLPEVINIRFLVSCSSTTMLELFFLYNC